MFKVLAEHPNFMLMGLYENDFPLLSFIEYLTNKMIKKHLNSVWKHLKVINVYNSYWLTKWILTLFLYSVPIK